MNERFKMCIIMCELIDFIRKLRFGLYANQYEMPLEVEEKARRKMFTITFDRLTDD